MTLEQILNTLTYREREVFKMRKGLGGSKFHTLDEVAQHFQVTPARITQIEEKTARKLWHPVRMRMVEALPETIRRDFMDELGPDPSAVKSEQVLSGIQAWFKGKPPEECQWCHKVPAPSGRKYCEACNEKLLKAIFPPREDFPKNGLDGG